MRSLKPAALLAGLGGICRNVRRADVRAQDFQHRGGHFGRRARRRPAQAENHRLHRSAERGTDRSGRRPDPLRGLGAGEAGRKAVPVALPELCRAACRGHGRRRAQALQGKAAHVCGRGALRAGAAAGLARSREPRDAAVHRAHRSGDQASPDHVGRGGVAQGPARRATTSTRCGAGARRRPVTICIRSRYQFEGKLPIGIQIANKLRESSKKIADYLEFESELTLRPPAEVDRDGACDA